MQLNAYLSFNGQCEAAFKFYERCLGGKIAVMMTYAETPMANELSADWQKKIVHSRGGGRSGADGGRSAAGAL